MTKKASHEALALIHRRAVEIIPEADLRHKMERSQRTGKPLRVKLGVDPTAPDIHLGISIPLQKLRDFQDLGHTAVMIVGDFTARIGDPSERNTTRPILSLEQIERNMKTYREQAFKILDPDKTEFRYNSEWLESMSFKEIMELTSKYTVARMLERDDFSVRYREGQSITILEFLYPLAQAYDSVAVQADVELGGTDQRFNLLVGREIQERYGQEPQAIVIMPLLEGTDGVRKMSKSYGNYIGITEPPNTMYGKLMSIPDSMMEKFVTLLTDVHWAKLKKLHPKEQKSALAGEIVKIYHGEEAAKAATAEFDRVFSQGGRPQDVPKVSVTRSQLKPDGTIWIVDLLQVTGLLRSRSEARRIIEQGGVELDGQKISSAQTDVKIKNGALLRVGKHRFAEIQVHEGA
ncbi:MAG: tyrosine--tRNA ligase [Candidatus Fraserbacteria bacterium RBG_16_55_9]|uniref:Tyrosine--tRNA ligase n=1 Tax=Fraserbacteria sp. (strain RBG_16_55_9) TaxID=1817864 RepID=A0A1F5UNR4_FRAXR|nr:MAG: tyrosine--tRNA ligase [Candidatus Fraserbacteria bacterium RBG_16_55_9]